MKWFKMQSDNLDDPFIQDLITKFGGQGYMAYFGIISLICRENKNNLTGKAEFSGTFLKQKFHISQRKLQDIFRFCQTKGKLIFHIDEENFNFDFPKILEIKDNYTKDLQVTSKKLSKHKEVDKEAYKEEIEGEVEKENPPRPPRPNYEDVDRDPRPKIDISPCLIHYEKEYQRIFQNMPSVSPLDAHKNLKPVIEIRGVVETNRLITEYLEYQDDKYVAKRGYPLCLFPHTINALLTARARSKEPTFEEKEAEIQRLHREDIEKFENSKKKETA